MAGGSCLLLLLFSVLLFDPANFGQNFGVCFAETSAKPAAHFGQTSAKRRRRNDESFEEVSSKLLRSWARKFIYTDKYLST